MDMPLMVFLHGPGQSPPAWQDVVSEINPEQPMVAPWLKGLKPTEHDGFQMDQSVESVMDLLESRGAEQADLIGFSLGGLVAMRLAASYPDRVAHVVLVSTPVIPDQKALARQRFAVKMMPAAAFTEVPKEQVLAGIDAMRQANIGVDLDRVQAPTLAIAGDSDKLGVMSAHIYQEKLGAAVRIIPSQDPNLLKSEPAKVAQLLSDFCADFLEDEPPETA